MVEPQTFCRKGFVEHVDLASLERCQCIGHCLQLDIAHQSQLGYSAVEHWEALFLKYVLLLGNPCEYRKRYSLRADFHPRHRLQCNFPSFPIVDTRTSDGCSNSKPTFDFFPVHAPTSYATPPCRGYLPHEQLLCEAQLAIMVAIHGLEHVQKSGGL